MQTIRALAEAVDAKDAYTRGHSERVGVYASKIAREMSFPKEFIERVYIAGLLHDVGKIGVPDHIITKPDRLTDAEYAWRLGRNYVRLEPGKAHLMRVER